MGFYLGNSARRIILGGRFWKIATATPEAPDVPDAPECSHSWDTENIIYTWAYDCTSCIASVKCKLCDEVLTEKSNDIYTEHCCDATCTEPADEEHYATFKNPIFNENPMACDYSHEYGEANPEAHPVDSIEYQSENFSTHIKYCTSCKTFVSESESHDYKYVADEFGCHPECETCGCVNNMAGDAHYFENGVCTRCGATEGGSGDSDCEHEETSEKTRVDPTCGASGNIVYQCNNCGYEFTEPIPATGAHDWKAATCTAPKTCKICGATEGEALSHIGGTATCTQQAKCTLCGTPYGVVDSNNHDFYQDDSEGNVCTCKACGYTNHNDSGIHPAKQATCTKTGLTEGKYCTKCGDTVVAQTTIPVDSNNHDFYDDDSEGPVCTCKDCGYAEHSDDYYTGDYPCEWCGQYKDS